MFTCKHNVQSGILTYKHLKQCSTDLTMWGCSDWLKADFIAAALNEKALKTNRTLPAQQQTADRQSKRQAGLWSI